MQSLLENIKNHDAVGITEAIAKVLKSKTKLAIQEARKQVAVEIFGEETETPEEAAKKAAAKKAAAKKAWNNDERMPWPKDYSKGKGSKSAISGFSEDEKSDAEKKAAAKKAAAKKAWNNDERMPWPKDYFKGKGSKSAISSFDENEAGGLTSKTARPGGKTNDLGLRISPGEKTPVEQRKTARPAEVIKKKNSASVNEDEMNEVLIHGKNLSPDQHREVLGAFTKRFTGENTPSWSKQKMTDGSSYKPTHATDKDWVHDHAFHFHKKTGKLSKRHQSAEPGYMADTPAMKKG